MLTASAAWLDAVTRADARIRVLVSINIAGTLYNALSGSVDTTSDLRSTAVAVQKVSPVGIEVDPLTRETQIAELFVELDDAWIRPIVVNNRIKGKKLICKIGAAELDETDFLGFFAGPIEEVAAENGTTIRISVLDPLILLDRQTVIGYWVNKHPLEILYKGDGTGILEKAGIPSIDTGSFDPQDAAYDGLEQIIVGRGGKAASSAAAGAVVEPVSALELARSLAWLVNGFLWPDESGQMTCVRFDPDAAAVDNWTEDDAIPGSITQETGDARMVNRFTFNFSRASGEGPGNNGYNFSFTAEDTASQAAYAYLGEPTRIVEESFDIDWLDGKGTLHPTASINNTDDHPSVSVWPANPEYYAGNRSEAWASVSADRPAYLYVSSWMSGGGTEIIKATALTKSSSTQIYIIDPEDQSYDLAATVSQGLVYSGTTRELFGSTKQTHPVLAGYSTMVHDITPIALLAIELLQRFAFGCPVLELDTLLTKYQVQIGDLVTFPWDKFVDYGLDGLTTTQKWEVVSKEVDIFANPPRIKWRLAYAGTITPTFGGRHNPRFADEQVASASLNDVSQGYVAQGLGVTDDGAGVGRVAAGMATNGKNRKYIPADATRTYTASKDTYVYVNVLSGGIVYNERPNGDPVPTSGSGAVALAKVVTNGGGIITAITNLQQTAPLLGTRLVDGAVVEAKLGALAVTSGKIGANAVIAGKLSDGAVDTTARLANAVVTAAKVATKTLGPAHMITSEKKISIFSNGNFAIRSRG